MSDFLDFWSLYTKGREYGFRSDDYAGGEHRGQDVPGLVEDHEWIGKPIPLLRPGRLVFSGTKEKLGGVFVFAVAGGEYDAYCHTRPVVDSFRLSTWADLAKWRGTSYRGPHLHLVRSRFRDAAWNTNRSTLDPRPIIRQRLRAATPKPAEVTPAPTPITLEEHDMPIIYVKAKSDTAVYALNTGTGKKRRVTSAEWAAINTAAAAAGEKVPYSSEKLTAAQIKAIPNQ